MSIQTRKPAAIIWQHSAERDQPAISLDENSKLDKESVLNKLRESFNFPDYFGDNWDAAYDLLLDYVDQMEGAATWRFSINRASNVNEADLADWIHMMTDLCTYAESRGLALRIVIHDSPKAGDQAFEEEAVSEIITSEVRESVERSVLCWLATTDENGQPNVSPKEVFAVADSQNIVVANIASPRSARNIRANQKVCLSFVDVFVQKGFKIIGTATEVKRSEPEYSHWVAPLLTMAGDRYPIHSVFVVSAIAAEPIVAPSYRLYPSETTEESQIQSALRTYGVTRDKDG
ncbi:pyridoxamine 5'-phosphate oxidase family protein [Nitrincola sp. MINF-07-Sa-05]|uniref:pyridoxamine 5'-phosphate oxidase family protein n=1 Tax=Nitrincola salilacus TaxID=3400273 RepID=UPI003917FA8D